MQRALVTAATLAIALAFAPAYGAPSGSQFDGTWFCRWVNTTPKGLHNDVKRTLVIRTAGASTEKSINDLSVSTPKGRKTLRVVQASHSTSTEIRGDVLVIHWAPLELLSPSPKDMPLGLHWQTGPFPLSFTLRGDKLVQVGRENSVFSRIK